MQIRLLGIAAAVALALATSVNAQTTPDKPRTGARADGTADAKPKVDTKAKKAEEERIEADAKAAKAKCGPLKGNAKDVCQQEAKANEKVAKAELNAKYDGSPRNQRKAEETKAEGAYEVAKEKCESNKDAAKACKSEAKAKYDKAKADIKVKYAASERKAATGATTGTPK
jgi:hypothetical protein